MKKSLSKCELEALNEEFVVEYTYISTAIEGNTLTLRKTDLVLKGLMIDKKPLREHLQTIGHKEVYDYICNLANDKVELSDYIIKQINYFVLTDKP